MGVGGQAVAPGAEPSGALRGGCKLGLAGLWCLKTASSQKLADKGMRVLLPGYGAALGSKAQLLAGHRIDFFLPKGSTGFCVWAGAWGPKGWLPGVSVLSRAFKEKPLGGGRCSP